MKKVKKNLVVRKKPLPLQSAFEKKHKFLEKILIKSSIGKAFSVFEMIQIIKKKFEKKQEKFGRKIKALTFALPIKKREQK